MILSTNYPFHDQFIDTIVLVKNLTPRTWALIFAGIALLALVLLSASLGGLQLSEGRAIPLDFQAPSLMENSVPSEWGRALLLIFRIMLLIAWVLLPVTLIYLIISKEARKRFLRDMATFLPILLLLMMLSNMRQGEGRGSEVQIGMPTGELPTAEVTPLPPLPAYAPPPAWVTTLAVFGLAVAVTLLIAGVIFVLWRRGKMRVEPLRMVELQAQAALDSIQSGGDLRDAIMRAYYQMLEAAREYRNINRGQDMTPHEFELLLRHRGLPSGPVHQLTELFEQVRYGGQTPGRADESRAVSSLSAIVSACQKTRGGG